MAQNLTRRSVLAGAATLPATAAISFQALAAVASSERGFHAGINLAGAEFGRVPGRVGVEYNYPGSQHLDYFASLRMTLVRLPFRWERLQPSLFGAFDAAELKRLTGLVSAARSRNLTVVLDPHNYAKRYLATDRWRVEHLIGSRAVPQKAFANFWAQLARTFSGDDDVWFGLMNEPNEISVSAWLDAANAAIAAIRAEGARNLVLVPGTNWTGAHSWQASGNEAMDGIRDPANSFAFEVHQYFDSNSSGGSAVAVSETIGSERIAAFESWARSRGFRAFLGEFGIADNATCLNAGRDLLQALEKSRDVWIGWAAWAGGPGWPNDAIFLLEPQSDGSMRPQTRVLLDAAVQLERNNNARRQKRAP